MIFWCEQPNTRISTTFGTVWMITLKFHQKYLESESVILSTEKERSDLQRKNAMIKLELLRKTGSKNFMMLNNHIVNGFWKQNLMKNGQPVTKNGKFSTMKKTVNTSLPMKNNPLINYFLAWSIKLNSIWTSYDAII